MKKNKFNKRRRNIVGWVIVILLAVLAVVGFLAMAMSVMCCYVNPEKFVWLSFFGLTFWVIFFSNLALLPLLLLMRSRWAWIPFIALLIGIPGIIKSYSFGRSHEGGELRVMSYNVLNFRNHHDKDKPREEVAADIAAMVKEYQPDVLCVQEYAIFTPKANREKDITNFGKMIEMPYHHYNTKSNFCSNVIFSKYPLSAIEEDIPLAQENDYGTVACMDAGEKGKFYVLCCHLVSFQLTNDEISAVSEGGESKERMGEYGKSIVGKLKLAYVRRSEEVVRLLNDIPDDGRPILLCGDFNDTPMSYTYHQIRKAGFTDSFVKTGRGIGYSYAGKLPWLRIDYVWTNAQIKPMSFKRIKYKCSDHYPVMLEFNVVKADLKSEDGL